MGCCTSIGKCVLIVLNLIVGLVGIIFLAAGILLLVSSDRINDTLADVLNAIPGLPGDFNLDTTASTAGSLTADFSPYFNTAGIVLVCIGGFLFIVTFLGCCGACCKSTICLTVYIIIMIVLVLIQSVVFICFFTGAFDSQIKSALQTTIDDKFVSIDSYDINSITWNVVMLQLKCCGIDNYLDFNSSTSWNNVRSYSGVQVTLVTPMACCKMSGSFPSATPVDDTCAYSPTNVNNNWNTGCWNELMDQVDKYQTWIILGCVVAVLVQVVLVIFGIMVCRDSKNSAVGV